MEMTVSEKFIKVLPLRERCKIINRVLKKRLDTILPMIMHEAEVDMWLIDWPGG